MTSLRFGTDDLHRVLERLSECEFLKGFKKIGKARYAKVAKDDIQHVIEFYIERRHNIVLVVAPVLIIDHKQARLVSDAGIGVRRSRSEVGLFGASLWEVATKVLNDRSSGGEYGLALVPVAEVLNDNEFFERGFWRSINDVEELVQQIDADLKTVGPQFFRERDTIPKLIGWLKADSAASGTVSRITLLSLYFVQGRHEEILKTVKSWTGNTASPMELRFAKYICDRLQW